MNEKICINMLLNITVKLCMSRLNDLSNSGRNLRAILSSHVISNLNNIDITVNGGKNLLKSL